MSALNISTEDLVHVDEDEEAPKVQPPVPVNNFQTFLLLCLTVVNAVIVVMLPFCITIYVSLRTISGGKSN